MSATQLYARAIKNTYEGKKELDGYEFIDSNGNVGVYQKKGQRLFAIRGMRVSDSADRSAVLSLISNDLKDSARYKKDKAFIQKHKTLGVKNVVVGHSLGGAIIDQLIDDGVFSRGLSFNPAIQPKDITKTSNRRLYNKDDFLYLLVGKYSGNHGLIDVDFKAFEGHWLVKLFKLWTAHRIDQFVHRKTDEPAEPEGTTGVRKPDPKKKKEKKKDEPKEDPPKKEGIVQSVIIEKSAMPDIDEAKAWVRSKGYKVVKVDETPNTFRFRQIDPSVMRTGKYIDRMVKLGDVGYLNMLYED
jgi:hypothetical protein